MLGSASVAQARAEALLGRAIGGCCGGRTKAASVLGFSFDDTEPTDALAIEAPVDDYAACKLLQERGLLLDLEGEWAEGGGWLDRVVCGAVLYKSRSSRRSSGKEAFLAFLLSSNAAPYPPGGPEEQEEEGGATIERNGADRGQFLWPRWTALHPKLRVDSLHLLPASGYMADPIQSLDLGHLLRMPSLEAKAKDSGDDVVRVVLDFGSQVVELQVVGERQAQRWAAAIRAALRSTLASAADVEGLELVEELQRFDRRTLEENAALARREQRRLLEELVTLTAQLERWDYDPASLDEAENLVGNLKQLMAWEDPLIETIPVLDVLERVAALPRLLVSAAVRGESRTDILDFWTAEYHTVLCRALEAVWIARVSTMRPTEIYRFAELVHAYRNLLASLHIEDPSLGPAVAEAAEVWGRRFFPGLTSLAEQVAFGAQVSQPEGSHCRTSAPFDLLSFLGPVCQSALLGPPETRQEAARLVDSTLYRYQAAVRGRIDETEDLCEGKDVAALIAAMIADASAFAQLSAQLLDEAREAGEPDESGVALFTKIALRMRGSAQALCERFVTHALKESGVVVLLGTPLCAEKVWQANAEIILVQGLKPVIETLQPLLPSTWGDVFVLRLLTRFQALEIFALLRVQGTPSESFTAASASEALRAQHAALMAAESQLSEESKPKLPSCLAPLEDLALLLQATAAELPSAALQAQQRHGKSFSKDSLRKLLKLRPEILEVAENAAAALAEPEAQASKTPSGEEEPLSAFGWASDLDWIRALLSERKAKDASDPDAAESSAGAQPGKKGKKKAGINDLESFLSSKQGLSLDDFLQLDDEPPQDEAAAPAPASPGAEVPQAFADLEEEDEDFDGDDREEDLEEDEKIRGFLAKFETEGVRFDSSDAIADLLGWRFLAAAQKIAHACLQTIQGGWVKLFFTVRRDMRSQRSLCWYVKPGDRVAHGALRISEIVEVVAKPVEHGTASFTIKYAGLAGTDTEELELQTPYESERDLWVSKLKLLIERETANLSKMVQAIPEGTVLSLQPTLHIRDPDRLGKKPAQSGVTALRKAMALNAMKR